MTMFFITFFTVYAAVNYYIFIRGWQSLALYPSARWVYLPVFLFTISGYILSRSIGENVPGWFYDILLWVGSIWFAFLLYFFLSIVLIDLLRLINWKLNFFPAFITQNYVTAKFITGVVIVIVVSIVILFGYLNTRNIVVNTHDINLPKKSGKLDELNVVLVADFHLTPINDGKKLKEIVEVINSLNPDIVLMPGDIVDDKVGILKIRKIGDDLRNIRSKYGVYASNGNHEFIVGIDEALPYLQSLDVKVLSDSAELIDESFFVIGRDDRARKNFTGVDRKPLAEILENVNKNYPTIIIDHTPLELDEIVKNNIDLQLSGHTHHGQLFPANLITSMIYEVSWGHLKKGNTQFYVTCGVGTWGPPVRIGSDSEVVNLKIKFVD
jgi:uncharacterized protein